MGTAVGTPTYVAGPPARFALDSADAIDFGAGALDNVWTGTAGWTYIGAVQTGPKPTSPKYILVKESSTNEFAFFRNKDGGLEFVVYTPAPNYENVQTAAVADNSTLVVTVRYNAQAPLGQRVKIFINGAAATEVSHKFSGTGGKIAASSARLRMGIVERGSYSSSPALGAAYVYNSVLTDADVTSNVAWISTNRRWTTSQTSQTTAVASVTVSPTTASLSVGGTKQFTATVKDASGNVLTGRTVTWASSAPNVATVSTSGLVTGVATGTTNVTATSEGKTATVATTVTSSSSTSSTPPPSGGASCSNLVTDVGTHGTSAMAKPGYLQSARDPDFGLPITRITGDPGTPIPVVGGTWGQ
ncbi:MAG TPA: Ig-like domain-containing protein, partial [Actinomycetes bacterium]|nr:Ig-like domain-containing protein [Actinomycetes bacterium]